MKKLFGSLVLLFALFSVTACSVIDNSLSIPRSLQSTVYETGIPRSSNHVVLIGTDIAALIGGVNGPNTVAQIQIVNANTGAVADGPVLNNSRYLFAANKIDKNRVVVAGGYHTNNGARSVINSIEMVDFSNNTSIIVAYLPKPLADFVGIFVEEQKAIYYIGGESSGGAISNNIYKFSVANYSITTMASMAYGRQDHTANLVGDVIVIIGGFDGTAMAAIEHFNVRNNTCYLAANLRFGRFIHRAIQVDAERLLICGGFDGNTSIAQTEIYNVYNSNVYRNVNLLSARDAFSIEKLFDGRIIVGGGAFNGNTLSDIDQFNVDWMSTRNEGYLSTPRDSPGSIVLSGDRILYTCGYQNGLFLSSVEVVQF